MTFSIPPGRIWRQACFALVALAALVAGCGGGTSQFEAFAPERLIAFGDETSALTADGHNYSINGTDTTTDAAGEVIETINCQLRPTWVQQLASTYGFVFEQCNPNRVDVFKAITHAAAAAQVDDIKTQIDAQIANGGFRDRDLTTVLAGANDIVELYRQYPSRTEEDLADELRQRGKRLALQVNRLIDLGAKVILVTVPDMGLTPYARKQQLEFGDTDRAALLSRLTAAFNEQLGVNILLDGHFVGIVQGDLRTQAMVRSPASFNLSNVTDAACLDTVPLEDCTASQLVPGATDLNWMWADDLRLAYPGQVQIASLAVDRARRNPF